MPGDNLPGHLFPGLFLPFYCHLVIEHCMFSFIGTYVFVLEWIRDGTRWVYAFTTVGQVPK